VPVDLPAFLAELLTTQVESAPGSDAPAASTAAPGSARSRPFRAGDT
jgi:hypothetical protein